MTTTDFTLRAAGPDDTAAIAEVWHAGWADGHLGHVPEQLAQHRQLDDFRRRVPGRLAGTVVATIDDRVVGFVMAHDDEVEQLYVAAGARGRGVADALLRRGRELVSANGFDRAWLAVATGNARARAFYERMGWTDAGPFEYAAQTATGSIAVSCHRYESA